MTTERSIAEAPAGRADVSGGMRPLAWAGILVVSFAAVLALAWISVATLLLIFAGVLLAVFLDGLTRGLGRVLPLSRPWRLTLVSLVLAGLFGGLIVLGGATVAVQTRDLGETIRTQSGTVRDWLKERGFNVEALEAIGGGAADGSQDSGQAPRPEAAPSVREGDGAKPEGAAGPVAGTLKSSGPLLSNAGSVLGPATTVILGLFNALGNLMVILFLGVAFAAAPGSYRDGILRFVPSRGRARGGQVLDGMGETLRNWLFGQFITMVVIFLFTWAGLALLGVGGALILGLQAGLLAFIPNIGALVAGAVIVLASLGSGFTATLGALGVYVAVQTLESYVLTPYVQKRALDIPPATLFAGQILFGVLFGLWGIALALPLMAVIKVLLDQLYVEETLGEAAGA